MVKVAMLSKWHVHASDYANQVRANGAEIVVVWDEDTTRGAAWAADLGVEFEPCLDKVLARADVDAVVCDAPTSMHKEVILPAVLAGKHVYTEKTLAATKADALEIKKAVEDKKIKFTISFPQRTSSTVVYAKQVIESGVLGQVNTVRLRNAHNGASGDWLPAYWYLEKDACGGAMMDLGCHPMYIASYLLGDPARITSIYNTITNREVEDNAINLIEFKNKAIAIVETSFVTPDSPWMFEIYGTKGNFFANDHKVKIKTPDTKKLNNEYVEVKNLPKALPSPMKSWLDAIENDTDVIFGIDDAVALSELLEGAYISHKGNTIHCF